MRSKANHHVGNNSKPIKGGNGPRSKMAKETKATYNDVAQPPISFSEAGENYGRDFFLILKLCFHSGQTRQFTKRTVVSETGYMTQVTHSLSSRNRVFSILTQSLRVFVPFSSVFFITQERDEDGEEYDENDFEGIEMTIEQSQ